MQNISGRKVHIRKHKWSDRNLHKHLRAWDHDKFSILMIKTGILIIAFDGLKTALHKSFWGINYIKIIKQKLFCIKFSFFLLSLMLYDYLEELNFPTRLAFLISFSWVFFSNLNLWCSKNLFFSLSILND